MSEAEPDWSHFFTRASERLAEHDRAIAEKAWDEGYTHCFDAQPDPDDVRSLKDNPYRKADT